MEQLLKEIGARIRKARVAKGMSQSNLAEALGVSPPYISNIETGKNAMTVTVLYQLTNILGVSADWVLRSNTAEAVQYTADEFNLILKDCTPSERIALMQMMQEMKTTIRNIKKADSLDD